MFLLNSCSDVCGWPVTTYASLHYHGNWGGCMQVACCKLEEVMVCCLIAAMEQKTALALPVCRWMVPCTSAPAPYVEAAEGKCCQTHHLYRFTALFSFLTVPYKLSWLKYIDIDWFKCGKPKMSYIYLAIQVEFFMVIILHAQIFCRIIATILTIEWCKTWNALLI